MPKAFEVTLCAAFVVSMPNPKAAIASIERRDQGDLTGITIRVPFLAIRFNARSQLALLAEDAVCGRHFGSVKSADS